MAETDLGGAPEVLLVDDDAATLAALGRLFHSEPYTLHMTDDPLQALDWSKSRRIDLIITDEFMPWMLGSDLLKAVRGFSPNAATMLLTGYPRATTIFRGVQAQVDLLVAKPWEDRALRRAARQLLERRAPRAGSGGMPAVGGGGP